MPDTVGAPSPSRLLLLLVLTTVTTTYYYDDYYHNNNNYYYYFFFFYQSLPYCYWDFYGYPAAGAVAAATANTPTTTTKDMQCTYTHSMRTTMIAVMVRIMPMLLETVVVNFFHPSQGSCLSSAWTSPTSPSYIYIYIYILLHPPYHTLRPPQKRTSTTFASHIS